MPTTSTCRITSTPEFIIKLTGTGKLLRIFVGENDRHGAQPLYTAIVELARKQGLSGATVFKGVEGFGGHSVVHAARVFDLSTDLPILIEIVDTEQKIRDFIPQLDALVHEGLVTLESVEIVHYKSGAPKGEVR
jgi:PII-like signaling protein